MAKLQAAVRACSGHSAEAEWLCVINTKRDAYVPLPAPKLPEHHGRGSVLSRMLDDGERAMECCLLDRTQLWLS